MPEWNPFFLCFCRYDCEFVISEVNADVKFHVRQKDGTFKDAGSDTRYIGKKISTKALESEEREDITLHYKYAEGSHQERAALQSGPEKDGSETSDIEVDIETPSDVMIGSPMEAKVVLKSTAGAKRFVELTIQVSAVSYIGALGKQVFSKSTVETVAAGDGELMHGVGYYYKILFVLFFISVYCTLYRVPSVVAIG